MLSLWASVLASSYASLKEDHENNKIVIKVPEVHDEENNYNLNKCSHSVHLCLPHHMLLKGKTMRIIK